MDPITIAGTFATITSLYGLYRSERHNRKDRSLADYLEWLRRHNHEHIVNLIEDNAELSRSLRILVEDQHEEMMGILRDLDAMMKGIAEHIDPLRDVAHAVGQSGQMMPAAIEILTKAAVDPHGHVLVMRGFGGTVQIDHARMYEQGDRRKQAEYEAAVDELAQLGFLSLLGGGELSESYTVSHYGYLLADRIDNPANTISE